MSKEERQKFIADTLSAKGHINRHDIKKRFGVSDTTAAYDFSLFQASNPDAMIYNNIWGRYEAAKCSNK